MPSIHLPYVNISLEVFALVVVLIILAACAHEYSNKKIGAMYFLQLQISVALTLLFDIVGWLGEGTPHLGILTLVAKTAAVCAFQIAIISLIGFLTANLHSNSRVALLLLNLFRALCVLSLLFCIGNAFFGYAFYINEEGHYVQAENEVISLLYLSFPMLSFFAIVLMSLFAKTTARINRFIFVIYTLFPAVGGILDYLFHGIALAYIGISITVLIIYTNIYLTRQKQIEEQKNALMLSQINPHFIYNTLSTIASMCDTAPKQAKYLTIDFSQYLRRNIGSLTSEDLIPFEQEMEHVACYLKIEKARFRERLSVIYAIHCKDFTIPPLTVQPLVENAIKHGVTKKSSGGFVKISTHEEETNYVIEIIDDGVGFDTEATDMHVGIQNVRSRIAMRCKGEVTVKSTVGIGTKVTIEIPKKKGKQK